MNVQGTKVHYKAAEEIGTYRAFILKFIADINENLGSAYGLPSQLSGKLDIRAECVRDYINDLEERNLIRFGDWVKVPGEKFKTKSYRITDKGRELLAGHFTWAKWPEIETLGLRLAVVKEYLRHHAVNDIPTNKSKAAGETGMSRNTLKSKADKIHGVPDDVWDSSKTPDYSDAPYSMTWMCNGYAYESPAEQCKEHEETLSEHNGKDIETEIAYWPDRTEKMTFQEAESIQEYLELYDYWIEARRAEKAAA